MPCLRAARTAMTVVARPLRAPPMAAMYTAISFIGNITLGPDQGLAADDDDAFVVGARRIGRKVGVE